MQKVESAYQPPSVCFICTASPTGPVCDTLLNFEPGPLTTRNGRIYICEACAQSAADALGLFDGHKARVEEARKEQAAAERRLDDFMELSETLKRLGLYPPATDVTAVPAVPAEEDVPAEPETPAEEPTPEPVEEPAPAPKPKAKKKA